MMISDICICIYKEQDLILLNIYFDIFINVCVCVSLNKNVEKKTTVEQMTQHLVSNSERC